MAIIIKKGVYKFKKVLSVPSAPIEEHINYQVNVIYKDTSYLLSCYAFDVKQDSTLESAVLAYGFSESFPKMPDLVFPITMEVYLASSGNNSWDVSIARFSESIKIIVFPEDTNASEMFGAWFTENTVILADILPMKIQSLISRANSTTGKNDTNLTSAVNSLIEGYGVGEEDYLLYIEQEDTAYETIAPAEDLDYAFLKRMGGATVVDKDAEGNPIGFKHAKVERIESIGKNRLPSDVMIASNWVNYSGAWWSYNLNFLADGWYCVSLKLKEGYTGDVYFYLQKSVDGGTTYTSVEAGYRSGGTLTFGYLVTANGLESTPFWFKVDKKSSIYRFIFNSLTQSKLDQIYDIQIERVNLTQEPSASYPPATYAPATAYSAYRGIIDSITIPEAVRSLEGYGREGSTLSYKDGAWWLSVTKDENLEALAEAIVTDLTDLFTEDNAIEVEGGGTIRFVNENEIAVPSIIGYAIVDLGITIPEGTLSITENGLYDVSAKAFADVNVKPPYDTFFIYDNGEFDITDYRNVKVDVPIPDGYIKPSGTLEIVENGTHDVEWYKDVIIKVPKVANLSSTTILERT